MSHKIGKKLDLHEPSSDDVPWFASIGTGGRHWQGTAIPSICKIAGVPVLHNRSIRATGIQMLRETGFADLVGTGEYLDTLDPSEEFQDEEDFEDLDQGEAEFMEYEEEEILETKPDLASFIGDQLEQEGQ